METLPIGTNRTLLSPEKSPDFKPVSGLGSLHFVYAALWQGDSVRISAIKTSGTLENILCVLWYSTDLRSNFTVVKASVRDLPNYNSDTTCAYIKCHLPEKGGRGMKETPLYVGLVNGNKSEESHRVRLKVENRDMDDRLVNKKTTTSTHGRDSRSSVLDPDNPRVVEFTVCIPAMYGYGNAAQLVEKLEMVRLLGAGRVVLYEHSIAPNVRSVLNFYTQEWAAGRETLEVVVLSWKLPHVKAFHYKGQIGAIDDCLYRYGWLSHYMVFNDLDEFIIPLRHSNWSQLIREKEKHNPGHAAFLFRCLVMNKDHSSPAKGFVAEAFDYMSSVLGYTQRDDFLYPIDKSKLIVNPRKIKSLAVHAVDEGSGPTLEIPVDQGLLYHYRWPLRPCKREAFDDRVSTKFGERLVQRLKSVWSKLEGVVTGFKVSHPDAWRATCNAGHEANPVMGPCFLC